MESFIANKNWKAIFRTKEDASQLKDAEQLRKGDIIILKTSYTKGTGHNISVLNVPVVGKATGDAINFDPQRDSYQGIELSVDYFNRESHTFEGGQFGSYRNTIKECNNQLLINYVDSLIKKNMSRIDIDKNLLEHSYNLILTGPPGTGKTYLAKEIAASIIGCDVNEVDKSEQFGFVQFHPSYDYTDFVEGLRPMEPDDNNNVGFELRDGIFKAFCEKALKNIVESKKTGKQLGKEVAAQQALDSFLGKATWIGGNSTKGAKMYRTHAKQNQFYVTKYDEKHIRITIPQNDKANNIILKRDDVIQLLTADDKVTSLKDVKRLLQQQYQTQQDSYTLAIYNEIFPKFEGDIKSSENSSVSKKNYVFVIDEINRGDLSKILGELFFSIDTGYRGKKGKVTTQYANMQTSGNAFDRYLDLTTYGHFFVPSNVYIIGTMNDIDRSVESMDFAMRRRFAWKEVTAEESMVMLDANPELDSVRDEIKNRMRNLNKAIEETEGLSEAYDIGAAYFMKYPDYGSFDSLWQYHLKGVLYEYLRGERDAKDKLEVLRKAYNNTK